MFTPKNPKALDALNALKIPLPDSMSFAERINRSYGFGSVDRDALRELLIALHCPPPCVGVVNETGWHLTCENAADAALEALDAEFVLGTDDDQENPDNRKP